MKFDVKNRFTGNVQFTADIDCAENEHPSIKLGLSVQWAIENDASLVRANLYGANLEGASLVRANLYGANLDRANLYRANLYGANLEGANLYDANLDRANLDRANLFRANLDGASLQGANLSRANLVGASLDGASSGINKHIKSIQLQTYPICYTSKVMQIGCECHAIEDWRNFSDKRIREMDGDSASNFWSKYKDFIFKAIELAPAEPTNYKKEDDNV